VANEEKWPFVEVQLLAEHQTYYLLVVSFEDGHIINLVMLTKQRRTKQLEYY